MVPTITTTTLTHDGELNEYVCVPEPTASTPVVPGSELGGLNNLDKTPRQTLDQTVYIVPSHSIPPVGPSSPDETPRQTLDQTVYIVPLPEPTTSHSIPPKDPEPVATSVVTTTRTAVQEHPSTLPHGGLQPPWAITYSPYKLDNGISACRTKDEIEADIAAIAGKGIKNIRLYNPDCDVLEFAAPACEKHGIKIILGIFAKPGAACRADGDLDSILNWAKWDQVILFVVGNEALLKGECNAKVMVDYIQEVKKKLQGRGYSGPVTIAEPLSVFQDHKSDLCGALDVFAIHCHPYFNPEKAAADSGQFLNEQVTLAESK